MNSQETIPPAERPTIIEELESFLSEELGEEIRIDEVADVFEVETNTTKIQFNITGSVFTIESIKSHADSAGGTIVRAIHTFCDDVGYDVIAEDVKDTARSFWEHMGYQESSTPGTYYRIL